MMLNHLHEINSYATRLRPKASVSSLKYDFISTKISSTKSIPEMERWCKTKHIISQPLDFNTREFTSHSNSMVEVWAWSPPGGEPHGHRYPWPSACHVYSSLSLTSHLPFPRTYSFNPDCYGWHLGPQSVCLQILSCVQHVPLLSLQVPVLASPLASVLTTFLVLW